MPTFDEIFQKAMTAAAEPVVRRPATVPFSTENYADLCPKYARKGLTKQQKGALGYYTFCLREEDRYTGSIFYRPDDHRSKELRTKAKDASDYCKMVGIKHP